MAMMRKLSIPLLCLLLTILEIAKKFPNERTLGMAEAVEVEVICVNENIKTILGIKTYYSWRRLYTGSGKPMTECGDWHQLNVCFDRYTWVLRTNRKSTEEARMQDRRNQLCIDAYGSDYGNAQPGNSGADTSSDGALFGKLATHHGGFLSMARYWSLGKGHFFNEGFKKHNVETGVCDA